MRIQPIATRDRTRQPAAKAATLERRNARRGKRAGQFLSFAIPRGLELGGAF